MAASVQRCEEAREKMQLQIQAQKKERDTLCRRLAKLCGIGIGLEGDPYAAFDACVKAPTCLREEERRQLTEQIKRKALEIRELEEAITRSREPPTSA